MTSSSLVAGERWKLMPVMARLAGHMGLGLTAAALRYGALPQPGPVRGRG